MKNYRRENTWFSLCGLNCALCPMHNMENGCPGCGGGEGHQSCAKIRCAIERKIGEFCFECMEYPCEKYEGASETDSFMTYQNIFKDTEYAKTKGIDEYKSIIDRKKAVLDKLLENYNDGRRKSLFCTAVNLLDEESLYNAVLSIENQVKNDMPLKEKAAEAARIIKETAAEKGISLKLRKNKK